MGLTASTVGPTGTCTCWPAELFAPLSSVTVSSTTYVPAVRKVWDGFRTSDEVLSLKSQCQCTIRPSGSVLESVNAQANPTHVTPNADRLGEIALVDASSRIGQTGRTYYNGLLDENAAAHMAFGSGFAKTRTVPLGNKRYGVNRSTTHIDVMIGTNALNADGITQSGKRVSLVSDGSWRF